MTDLRELGRAMREAQRANLNDPNDDGKRFAMWDAEAAFDKALNETPAATSSEAIKTVPLQVSDPSTRDAARSAGIDDALKCARNALSQISVDRERNGTAAEFHVAERCVKAIVDLQVQFRQQAREHLSAPPSETPPPPGFNEPEPHVPQYPHPMRAPPSEPRAALADDDPTDLDNWHEDSDMGAR
jgi:hypothetical protein